MQKRPIYLGIATLSLVTLVGTAAVMALPAGQAQAQLPEISASESAETLKALRPPKRQRPVVAIVGANEGSETTDYLIPYGVLKRADVADVFALGMKSGPLALMPALTISPDDAVADFDVRFPDGADYVVVPAMHNSNDPAVIRWIKSQVDKGAIIIGICEGARLLGNAGLLDGRRATTHWYALEKLRKRHPAMIYVPDRRFVVDRGVATTTGVSASIPMSLALIEAIAGREKAKQVADDLAVDSWDARHSSGAFKLNRGFVTSAAANTLAFWNHEKLGVELKPGIDEIALALTADAWSRTYKSQAMAIGADGISVTTRFGLAVIPDRTKAKWKSGVFLPALDASKPTKALDYALAGISDRYGVKTAAFVALQLEYPLDPQRYPERALR
jgi:putative intracellular protease/amidase